MIWDWKRMENVSAEEQQSDFGCVCNAINCNFALLPGWHRQQLEIILDQEQHHGDLGHICNLLNCNFFPGKPCFPPPIVLHCVFCCIALVVCSNTYIQQTLLSNTCVDTQCILLHQSPPTMLHTPVATSTIPQQSVGQKKLCNCRTDIHPLTCQLESC